MDAGYIYVTKNLAFKRSLLKIGRSKRDPLGRKNELYRNSTGVPEPFILVFYRKVCDQVLSEGKVHSILASYRHNDKREFFTIDIDSAKEAINLACDAVEESYGHPIPEKHSVCFDVNYDEYKELNSTITEPDFSNIEAGGEWIDPRKTIPGPPGRSILTQEQEHRIRVFSHVFKDIFPENPRWSNPDEWVIDFTKDLSPESEIQIWEKMAKAYVKFTKAERLNRNEIIEAFSYVQIRSQASKNEVKNQFERTHLNKRKFKVLDSFCRWKGVPLKVVR